MIKISLCIITKNECTLINECLKRIKKYVPSHHEIVVLDTGSSDDTCETVLQYTKNLYHYTWCNDFAAARNEIIKYAHNDFILMIDSDEWIDAWDENLLQRRISGSPESIGKITRKDSFTQQGKDYLSTEEMGRLFSKKVYHYEGSIHEQITFLDSSLKHYRFYSLPIVCTHQAYMGNLDLRRKRALRNIQLLNAEAIKKPDDPYLYYQLGQSYYMMEDYENAVVYFSKGLSFDVNPRLIYVQNMVETFGYSLINTGRVKDALFVEDAYEEFAGSADFVFLVGLIYMQNARFDDAIREFLKAATFPSCKVDGANSYRAYYNAGVIYECTGRIREAVDCYTKCGDFSEAQKRLVFLKNQPVE